MSELDLRTTLDQVFTPSHPAIWNYVDRGDDEQRFIDGLLEPGLQVMVYGPTGVGKSSLVLSTLNKLELTHYTFPFDASISSSNLFAKIMQGLGFDRTQSKSNQNEATTTGAVEASGSLWQLLTFKGTVGRAAKKAVTTVSLPYFSEADADTVVDALISLDCIIFFDDMEKVKDDETRQLLAHLGKKLSDKAASTKTRAKVIYAGISQEVSKLVPADPSLRDRLADQLLKPLPNMTTKEIFDNGWSAANFTFDSINTLTLAKLCCGYPRYAHWLGKHACLSAFRNDRKAIIPDDIDHAISIVVNNFRDKYQAVIDAATNHKKGKRIRERILHAIALSDDADVHFDEILKKTAELCGESLKKGQISGPLGELRTERRGDVLELGRQIGFYRFTDMMMKPYLRMVLKEQHDTATERFLEFLEELDHS